LLLKIKIKKTTTKASFYIFHILGKKIYIYIEAKKEEKKGVELKRELFAKMISMAIRMAAIRAHCSDFISCSVVNAGKDLGHEF
jgi:hypothetical protein